MRSVFIDSDVLLDLVLERNLYYDWALGLFLLIDKKEFSGCTTVHSLLNIHYFARKANGEQSARKSIKLLSEKLSVITEDAEMVEKR